ncbi:MAG TPA: DUF1697 domain-containing protein [Prolixibacteraceae bacterium]|nr:DUF1697 domain-containing protein [Prolixibacteraceae bacterium]
MPKYVAIFRGINVGTGRKVPMVDLKVLCAKLGLVNVQSYIQSGNIIFELAKPEAIVALEESLHLAISETFGFDIPVILRTSEEMEKSSSTNPFLKEKDVDIEKLHLTFLREVPAPELIEKIKAFQFLPDRYEIIGNDVFVYCPNGYGRTKITNDFFEKKLKVQATTRNWKTVMKLLELSNLNE